MPPRSDPIRRCAYKQPMNDKYQCQKAGDKYQPGMDIWYCQIHDGHAKDRCQFLVEWAGKGAQCEQLGHPDEGTGKKLCARHATRSKGDGWPQVKDATPRKPKDSARVFELVDTQHVEDYLIPECSMDVLVSSSSTTIEQASHALCLAETDTESTTKEPNATAVETENHILPAKKDGIDAEATEDILHCPATPALETVSTTESEVSYNLVAPSTTTTHARGFDTPPAAHPPQRAPKLVVRTKPEEFPSLYQPSHTRVDSLEPLFPRPLSPAPRTSPPLTLPVRQTLNRSFQFPDARLSDASISDPSSPSPITSFLTLQTASPSPTHMAAAYVQCCVCLEKHGEYNMCEVEGCGHRYRGLCLKIARKMGVLRRFNCGVCRMWMGE